MSPTPVVALNFFTTKDSSSLKQCELGKWDFMEAIYSLCLSKKNLTSGLSRISKRTWMNVKEAGDACRHWWMKEALEF
ncbi:hypothetical protein V6N11_030910 [Hibiscus sabdariffa]|uniref:Uncharacterized protein n=2 Tax=Hibiscus sabdariffa TaxID=183260 RepID=A0ABR2BCA5_9ROSI